MGDCNCLEGSEQGSSKQGVVLQYGDWIRGVEERLIEERQFRLGHAGYHGCRQESFPREEVHSAPQKDEVCRDQIVHGIEMSAIESVQKFVPRGQKERSEARLSHDEMIRVI
ncbi:MAG: hypothetical protein GY696_24045 [Gammaproteobacteria bacterium]|nr:hypothetical protein [Gammaproteobacteria bacterium]